MAVSQITPVILAGGKGEHLWLLSRKHYPKQLLPLLTFRSLLHENESTYIPTAMKHRLENPGRIELELMEVQSGSYLGEDDVICYDDVYGREKD